MRNDESAPSVLRSALFTIFKSLAKTALRYGVSAGTAEALIRRAWVEAAVESLQSQGKKPMSSKICAVTGLYRKEVVRLRSLPPLDVGEKEDKYNRPARVVTGWLRDERFLTSKRRPAVLRLEGERSFQELVRLYSGDMSPRAMLDELLRTKSVEIGRANTVRLLSRGFIAPKSGIEGLQILGDDVSDLIDTIDHNLDAEPDHRRLQRKVSYRHIPQRHLPAFEQYAARHSQALLEKFDLWLAKHDTEEIEEGTPGSRVGVGIYLISNENNSSDSDGKQT
jgi:hypothetical protein